MILRTFDKPTNIIIIGSSIDNCGNIYKLTDDFSFFDIKIKNKEIGIESDGFFTIITEEEIYHYISNSNSELEDNYEIYQKAGIVLLKNFEGNIEGVLINYDSKELNFDETDYIYHQYDDTEFKVLLPELTEYQSIDYNNFLKYCNVVINIYSRNNKIDEIIK